MNKVGIRTKINFCVANAAPKSPFKSWIRAVVVPHPQQECPVQYVHKQGGNQADNPNSSLVAMMAINPAIEVQIQCVRTY
jgi:hypothetical protein